ncbi:hypothetical protein SAMN05421770_101536 [Granulicella rosea]|uniref:Uncharacterized protein n=1 Tax=Granulicella rosea TaxID=474952 RepID=A0A239DNM1_9BACT|nr:hypothetical protein SAMN05421770_101536 [Granulicella rosea]
MQDARDTFYAMLRDRIAAGNPARTVVVRGATRPGVVVVENELPAASVDGLSLTDVFCLRWTALRVEAGALPLAAMTCEVRYGTDGTTGAAGMDRGRALAAMDAELAFALQTEPQSAPKLSFVTGVVRGTNVFWSDPLFGPVATHGERLERVATVEVYSYQEAGEL